uniref:Zmp:0000000624 n=1 Tax=Cyprinus carpio TaxID=7962 RepID=A0A8C2J5U5_CYPCA
MYKYVNTGGPGCAKQTHTMAQEPSGAEDENSSDDEKDLSPEEKRVLERKMKKILKKEEKKKLKEEGKSIEKDKVQSNLAEKVALEYLTCWSERREEWKFHKGRQIWLLQNMYDTTKMTDNHFKVLLAYLEGMRGASRSITLQKAEAIVRWEGQGEEEDTADAEKKKQRAKQVVQLL